MIDTIEKQLKTSDPGRKISNLVLRVENDRLLILGRTNSYYNKQVIGQAVVSLLRENALSFLISNEVSVEKNR